MKNYLIDEHTFKKFVTKVKSSAAGDQITAVVKQSQNVVGIFLKALETLEKLLKQS